MQYMLVQNGIGIEDILEAIVARVPPPKVPSDDVLRASVFDSVFDSFRGVVSYLVSCQEQCLEDENKNDEHG